MSVHEYREIEAGERPAVVGAWDRICKQFGWPRTFVGSTSTPH